MSGGRTYIEPSRPQSRYQDARTRPTNPVGRIHLSILYGGAITMTMVLLPSKSALLRKTQRAARLTPLSTRNARRNPDQEVADACLKLMAVLTAADLSSLACFTRFRLGRVGLNPEDGEDIVQDALLAVLRGRKSSATGRHPRRADLADSGAFIAYLHSVIGSLVEAERRCPEHRFVFASLEALLPLDTQHALFSTFDSSLELADLKNEFFRCLHRQAPSRLRDLVAAWNQHWQDCERIPLLGRHRRCRVELRKLAAQALRKLSTPNMRTTGKHNECP
jgi:hypothetical protein